MAQDEIQRLERERDADLEARRYDAAREKTLQLQRLRASHGLVSPSYTAPPSPTTAASPAAPEPSVPRPHKKWGVGTVLLGIFGVVIGSCLLLSMWGNASRSSPQGQATAAAEVARCADAVKRVQEYKAPGQQLPLLETIVINLATDRRPARAEGWEAPNAGSDFCLVSFRAVVGNETQRYTWLLDLKTNRVEAKDDATKRLSGW